MTTTETPGFVDDSMAASTPSEPGRALSGHTSRRYVDESIEASAVIESYCLIGDDGFFVPQLVMSTDSLAGQLAKESGRRLDDQAYLITQAWIDRRISRRGYLGGVSLDLNPAQPGFPQDLGHPDVPAVLFYEIAPGSHLATCGQCDHCRGQAPADVTGCRHHRSAMAVWFQPEVDELGYAVNPRDGRNGRQYSDDTFHAGYHGIVRLFGSLREAAEAKRDLLRAVRTLATPESADEADTVREGQLAEDERADTAGRRRASATPRERAAF